MTKNLHVLVGAAGVPTSHMEQLGSTALPAAPARWRGRRGAARPAPAPPPPRTLVEIFAATAARHPRRTALEAPDAKLTYSELARRAATLAGQLAGHGIGAGDRVAVSLPSGTAELYVAILGVLTAGAAYVPIDADDPPERSRQIVTSAGACAWVREGLVIEPLAQQGERLHGAGWGSEGRARSPAAPSLGNDAWVIFTSGSTGRPKGVAVTHRAAAAFVDAEAQLWRVTPADRVLAGLSVAFDASCEEIWLAWRNGAALVPAPRQTVRAGEELGGWLQERKITVVSTVPTLAAMWDEACLRDVRLLILGGEACPELLGWRLAAGREVWNTYGPTEATVVSTATPILPGRPITIGQPLPGWQVAVLDGDALAEPGQPGELVIAGVGLARYLDPALDRERYAGVSELGWERAYRTGDIVRDGPDGLEFISRRDDQVKIGGRRIELGEVEAALAQAPGVRASAVAVRESASGNRLLVGYVVASGDRIASAGDAAAIRERLTRCLPAGLVPLIAFVDELPRSTSGKVDRRALPWPLVAEAAVPVPAAAAQPESEAGATGRSASAVVSASATAGAEPLDELETWVADRWVEQLGPLALAPDSDFFALGGTSLIAAKLISVIRRRYPTTAVADLYRTPTLRGFAARLERLGAAPEVATIQTARPRRAWAPLQLATVLALACFGVPAWALGVLAVDRFYHVGPQLPWGLIVGGWIAFESAPVRAGLVVIARRALLHGVGPGRYPRRGPVATRVLMLERLADVCRLDGLAGTPWAARYARLSGHTIGAGARLATLPPVSGLVTVGAGATVEPDVDLHGWWIEGNQLVIDRVEIGAGARVGTRALLMPGATIGAGAEIEPGTVIDGNVPPGERWGGVPASRIGDAGEHWPAMPAPTPSRRQRRFWTAMFALGLASDSVLPLLAAAPSIGLFLLVEPSGFSTGAIVREMILLAPAIALLFTLGYALVAAAASRALMPLVKTGLQPALGATGWALWMQGAVMDGARTAIFPVYASSFTRRWLRLCGVPVGERTEVSVTTGLSFLTSLGETSFAADDVVFATARSRAGWLHVEPIAVGDRSFLGNSALLPGSTSVGDDSLIGLMTVAPVHIRDGTSWLGAPALELPRRPRQADPSRTVNPPWRLRAARRLMDVIRILVPPSVATVLGALVYDGVATTGARLGVPAMVLATLVLLLLAGIVAVLVTVAVKWLLMGRYRPGEHPLFSFYVWRDEIVNSCQEQLAGPWLLGFALGTPLIGVYLRLMGARVGRDVWIENLNTTEFDLTCFGDGCAANRATVVETHLFHDRIMSTGPSRIGAGATLGPASVVLPDTVIGDRTVVGGRAIVLRGEELPAGTRWHGAPVVPA